MKKILLKIFVLLFIFSSNNAFALPKGYPKCVPAAKAARMSDSQRRSAVRRKRAAGNPGGKPTNVKTFKARSGGLATKGYGIALR